MKKMFILVSMLLLVCVIFAEEYDSKIVKEINKLSDKIKIVSADDLDSHCVDVKSPGYISGDFNGDKINDYGVLAIGVENDTATFWYFAFPGKKDKTFKKILLDKFQIRHYGIKKTENFFKKAKQRFFLDLEKAQTNECDSIVVVHCGEFYSWRYCWDIKTKAFLKEWITE